MPIETIYADAFVEHLLNDPTLLGSTALNGAIENTVFKNTARQGASYPLIVYSLYDTDDGNSGNAVRLWTRHLYRIRVVGMVDKGVLQNGSRVRAAANRMDELLRNVRRQSFTVDTVTYNFNVWRESELPPPREEPGQTADIRYRLYGGIYRVEQFT